MRKMIEQISVRTPGEIGEQFFENAVIRKIYACRPIHSFFNVSRLNNFVNMIVLCQFSVFFDNNKKLDTFLQSVQVVEFLGCRPH